MSLNLSLETLCQEINQRTITERMRAIDLIRQSFDNFSEKENDFVNHQIAEENYSMQDVFAAWDSEQSPEDMANELRKSRNILSSKAC